MRSFVPTVGQPRRPGLRRIIEERAWVRHPVSTTRQRLSLLLLGLLILGFTLYLVNTRDAAIRRRAIAFLSEVTTGDVHVGQAHFRMFGGITLDDVEVAVRYDEQLDPKATDAASREIFSAKSVMLIHNPWRLLLGSLKVDHLIAAEPTITLVHNVDTGLRNWQLLVRPERTESKKKTTIPRPKITIRSARAVSVSVHSDGSREERSEELDADIRAQPQSDTGFCIEVRRFSEPAERTTVMFDPATKLVTNTPFVDARTVRLQLPKVAQRFFDQINLQGEVKLGRLVYADRTGDGMDSEIQLRRVRCTVPLSVLRSNHGSEVASSAPASPDETVATLTDANGRIALHGGKLDVDVTGLFNGSKCSVKGALSNVENGLAQMGIDVHLHGARVPAPVDSARARLIEDPGVPAALRAFFEDYDPRGAFEVDMDLRRPVGPQGQVELFGTLKPLGASGNCRFFPYPVENLQGILRIDGPHIYLENLTGDHGPTKIRLNARIDRSTPWNDVSVDISGENVQLDDALYGGLSDHHRELWRRFNPRGRANLLINMVRPKARGNEPQPAWRNHVEATLSDTRMEFTAYPYPLDRVEGRLILDDDRIQFDGLTGRRDSAVVRFDGEATFPVQKPATINLRLDAKGVPLDQMLARSLPPEGRGAFEQFQPQGQIDLSGRITLGEGSDELQYDLIAKVSDAAISYQQFPYRITDVVGEVALRPDGFSIVNVSGRHGDAAITARGDIARRRDGYVADLVFDCRRLELSHELYDALPASLQKVWTMLRPEGMVHIETALHHVSQGDHVEQRHRSRLDIESGAFCFSGFPLRMSGVTGNVVLSDRLVEIEKMTGRCGASPVSISGRIELPDGGLSGTLVVDARKLTFGKPLSDAVPDGLARKLADVKATGEFDLRLDPLQFVTDADGATRWSFRGGMDLHGAGADMGVEIRACDGELRGEGVVETDGMLSLDAEASLEHVQLAGWDLENVDGRILKDAETARIDIREVSADAYGGQATGAAQIRYGKAGADYQVSVVARDMQLGRYLEAASASAPPIAPTGEKRSGGRGSIDGNLIIRGQTGAEGFREGSGEVFVRRAEVWRLPIVFLIFQVLNLTPDENVFHDGWLKFNLDQESMVFHTIDLQGKALSFIGKGRMALATKQLDVTLLARSPVRIRLPVLSDVVEAFSREVMEVHIGGTFDKPSISPQPLRSLAAIVKFLFPPPKPQPKAELLSPAAGK